MILTIIIAAIPFASAATVLDETKKVSFTVNCSKPGYTFEVFRVADLKTTSGSTNETSYSPLFDSISSEVKAGNSKNILAKLDSLFDKHQDLFKSGTGYLLCEMHQVSRGR